jgi:putative redox protein
LASKNINVEVEIILENGKETKLTRSVEFQGDLTQEQKERCLEIANKCPLHNLLTSNVSIETTMVP